MAYLLIGATICFTVAGQLLVKAGMLQMGPLPGNFTGLSGFVIHSLLNIKVASGLIMAVLAAVTWMGALSLNDLSFAYPFMGLAIVLVLTLTPILFRETIPWTRWLGVAIVCLGLWIAAR